MNELIERLAREAGDTWESTLPSDKLFLEAFAKAVARECSEIANNAGDATASWRISDDICQRFEIT